MSQPIFVFKNQLTRYLFEPHLNYLHLEAFADNLVQAYPTYTIDEIIPEIEKEVCFVFSKFRKWCLSSINYGISIFSSNNCPELYEL